MKPQSESAPQICAIDDAGAVPPRSAASEVPSQSDAEQALVDRLLKGDLDAAIRDFEQLAHAAGIHAAAQALPLITPAVRRMESMWQRDQLSFSEVVFGFWALQRLMHYFGLSRPPREAEPGSQGHVLLSPAPGALHVFGVLVVAESFRTAGWNVRQLLESHRDTILASVRDEYFDVVGLSLGQDADLLGLSDFIVTLRRESRNPNVRVILGGNIFAAPRAQYDFLAADFVSFDLEETLEFAGAAGLIGRLS